MALAVLDFIPFALYSTNVAILNELKKFHHQSALMVAYSFFKLAFMVVLSELFFSIEIAVIGMALSSFLTLLLSYSSLLKTYWEKPLVSSNTPQLHDLHSIAISVFIVIATGILINIDFWCLKANNPDDMVLLGKYGVVANFSRAFYFIVSIIFYKYFVLLKDHASVLNSMKSWSVLKNLLTVGMLFLANILIVYTILGRVVSLFFGEAYIEAVIIGREILPYQTAFFVSIFMLQSFFYTSLKIAVLIMLILNISLFYFLVNLLYPLHDLSSLRYAFCTIIVMNVIFFLSLIITDSQQFKSLGKKRLL
jgi:O-antigen/teichoic acid export membrane protein